MFIDTGSSGGGSLGPWMRWTSEGSARKGLVPESWVLRDKDENGQTAESNVEAFKTGCVMDLDSLKLGWERDGLPGTAPERRWNPSVSQSTPRPDSSNKATGGFAWGEALSVRCAIGGGLAATWEQGSFGAYEAFRRLATQINATDPKNGTLPLVKQTGVEHRKLKNGSSAIPVLDIVKWVQRPDCLKEGAVPIDTGHAAPAAVAPVTPQPAQAPVAAPADAEF